MKTDEGKIVLFHPHVPESAIHAVERTLRTRWIGQGPRVEEFERRFSDRFGSGRPAVAVGAGTDALHLAYILAGINEGKEIIAPVLTCAATNIPLLYMRAKVQFADIQPRTLNIDPSHVRELVNEHTAAIVCVHYGGLACDMDQLGSIALAWGIPVIEDAAHALGATYHGIPVGSLSDFTAFSFQAIKHITTGDGGMLTIKQNSLAEKAKRIRWFGIDRTSEYVGMGDNDIKELGYKYQMTDIAASMGLAGLDELDQVLALRRKLFEKYKEELEGVPGIELIGGDYTDREHAAWLCTIVSENRSDLQRKLSENMIESGQVHHRNDRYSIFSGLRKELPTMNALEDRYLSLPLHTKMTFGDVERICSVIRCGW